MGDKGETSVNSCGPRNPEWETIVGDKYGRQVWETSVGDKWERSGRQVYTHAAQGTQSQRQVWETSVGDKCKLMRPKEPRVGDKRETSVNSCGPRHPEWETDVGDKCGRQVGDKCKLMRPKEPRLGDKCGKQVWETSVGDKCGRQVWETSGRQV